MHVPTLTNGEVTIRGVKMRDWRELERALLDNRSWLQPWEATNPSGSYGFDVRGAIRNLTAQANEHVALPFVVEVDGEIVGQLTVSSISYGAVSSASLGYWVTQRVAGRGITPTAVAMAIDHCFGVVGLHRMEICIRPENTKSMRVVEKLGLRYEGLRRRYIHIDGGWRDHFCYGVVREEVPFGVLDRWVGGRADARLATIPESDRERAEQPLSVDPGPTQAQ